MLGRILRYEGARFLLAWLVPDRFGTNIRFKRALTGGSPAA